MCSSFHVELGCLQQMSLFIYFRFINNYWCVYINYIILINYINILIDKSIARDRDCVSAVFVSITNVRCSTPLYWFP